MLVSAVAIVLSRIFGTGWLRQFLGQMFGIGSQQHGDQSHATETDTGRPPSCLPPTTTTELHIDLSSTNDARPAPQTSVLFEIEEI